MSEINVLHEVVRLVAAENIRGQLEHSEDTLEFLESIEFKTEDDYRRIEQGKQAIDKIRTPEYLQALENILTEGYSKLDSQHLGMLYDQIELDREVGRVGAEMAPKMRKLQKDFIEGVFKKPTTH